MTTPLSSVVGLREGERLRDEGMNRAATGRQRLIWQFQLALLVAIRTAPNRTATTDDATDDLAAMFHDGGKWRGAAVNELKRLGLIQQAGFLSSSRPSRHAGVIRAWQGTDDAAIDVYCDTLRSLLTETADDAERAEPPQQRDLFDLAGCN